MAGRIVAAVSRFQPVRRGAAAVTAAGALVVLAGCTGGGSTENPASSSAPASASTTAEADIWDPCSIPDPALREAGIKPESRSKEFPPTDGWKICGWYYTIAGWYGVDIYSAPVPMVKIKENKQNRDTKTVDVNGKEGFQFRDQIDKDTCAVALAYGNRTVLSTVRISAITGRQGNDCDEALLVARKLEKYYH